ncbi:hypothetical protein BX600DRAFT_51149 [Xylariales sp. PMI_506]|nr:hypothetical protein BX600DRAFT_51149 [Xylariales sp. PMI_506]
MNSLYLALVLSLHFISALCAPITSGDVAGQPAAGSDLLNRLVVLDSRKTSATPTVKAVQQAADNFASDVSTVSHSLNTLGTTTSQTERVTLANAGYKAESNENAQRAVLFAAGSNTNANTKIVDNTPTVLDGLSSIASNPSDANTEKQLATMEAARNANILPSITSLTQSAFNAVGIDATAEKFASTTGTAALKKLLGKRED